MLKKRKTYELLLYQKLAIFNLSPIIRFPANLKKTEMTRTEELDCGNFFDQFEDLIDFPSDPIHGSLNFNDFSPENEIDPIFSGDPTDTTAAGAVSYLSVPVPYEDMLQLEWLSNFFENSSVVEEEDNMVKTESPHNHNSLSSPISVLESSSTVTTATTSSSSCSGGGGGGKTKRGPRSKRPRPPTFTPRSDNFAESRIVIPGEEPEKKKIKKIKKAACSSSSSNQLTVIRKCMHCEITKTPQWRMGPMGPKTLCNACGVRHKSGRLFPEYRPAASPTFVPTLHSNSHKKVMEMRAV